MVHIEEVEEVQHLIESDPVSLNVFCLGCILCDHCSDDREKGEQNEERECEFERSEKVKEYGKESLFLSPNRILRFFHRNSYTKRDQWPADRQGSI